MSPSNSAAAFVLLLELAAILFAGCLMGWLLHGPDLDRLVA
jgi:hypothetical protein